MSELIEIFPFAFGVLLGLTWLRFGGPRVWRVPRIEEKRIEGERE